MPEAQKSSPATQAAAARLLLIDDDRQLTASLERLLRLEGLAADSVHTAQEGEAAALSHPYALIVLDVMLPGGDGRVLLRKLRARTDVPIIMLTARGDDHDRILGLEAGADDYLPKPFQVRELIARIRAVLKRQGARSNATHSTTVGDLEIQPVTRRILQHGIEVQLTGAEFDILMLLVQSGGKAVSRDTLAEACLGRSIGPFDRSVDNHISNLRKKLGATTDAGIERIRSLRGTGYIYTGVETTA
ncbi:MAG: response regulator transcription factor [Acidobacteriaceae bacterium]|nr:response regulator transcription factor [Acidobacteriaceae bacterium]